MDYMLTEKLREDLKRPFGVLYAGVGEIKDLLASRYVISVGDKITEALLGQGIKPGLSIYDGKTKRIEIGIPASLEELEAVEIRVKNPAGRLTQEAIDAVEQAVASGARTKIIVEGEEDLLTLAAIRLSPEGSAVLYGQPDEGVVLIEVNKKTKDKAERIFSEMRKQENGNRDTG